VFDFVKIPQTSKNVSGCRFISNCCCLFAKFKVEKELFVQYILILLLRTLSRYKCAYICSRPSSTRSIYPSVQFLKLEQMRLINNYLHASERFSEHSTECMAFVQMSHLDIERLHDEKTTTQSITFNFF
jgi:hypothetical protein